MARDWTEEPWRVILNGRGGYGVGPGLVGADSDLYFAEGDPSHLLRAAECVNACRSYDDPREVPSKAAVEAAGDALRRAAAVFDATENDVGADIMRTALAGLRAGGEASACPPHDFGQHDGVRLSEMIQRTCPKCGVEAAGILGAIIRGVGGEVK